MSWVNGQSRVGFRGALLLIALVGGLFAMHGLADHGTTHGEPVGVHHAGEGLSQAPAEFVTGSRGTGHSGHPEGAICLALLITGLALLFGRFRRTPASLPAAREPVATRSWSPIRARAPDPPDLTRLGICRC